MQKIKLPKIIGHRGAKGLAPENTLASIKKALSFGLSFVEIDVKVTKDNIPILIHDKTINRTTNGKGMCHKYNFKELKNLDAGSWFSSRYKKEKILSLEDCIDFIKTNKMGINIELKPNKGKEEDNVIAIQNIIKNNYKINCFFSSFDVLSVKLIQEKIPYIPRGILIDKSNKESLKDTVNICKKYDCFSVGLDKKITNYEIIKYFKSMNLLVNIFTVNNIQSAKTFFAWGADSIFTDRPDYFKHFQAF